MSKLVTFGGCSHVARNRGGCPIENLPRRGARFLICAVLLAKGAMVVGQELKHLPPLSAIAQESVYQQPQLVDLNGLNTTQEPSGIGWFASAEVLVMRANRAGLNYAIIDPDADANPEGRVLALDNDLSYDPGFRVALGMTLDQRDQIDFAYLHFAQSKSVGVLEPPGGKIWIPVMPPDQTENYTRVDASYALDLNVFDVTYRHHFRLFGGAARVSGGVRIANLDQRFHVLGSIGGGGSNPEDNYDASVRFAGAGPQFGVGFERQVIGHLAIFGNANGSLVLGKFDNEVFLTENNNFEIDIFQEFSQTVPVADIELGFVWEPWFLRRSRFLFGWQQMNWFNMSPQKQFVEDGGNDQGTFVDLSHDLSLSAFFSRFEYRY